MIFLRLSEVDPNSLLALGKLSGTRSRLYQSKQASNYVRSKQESKYVRSFLRSSQISQPNTRWKALEEIYQIYIPLHLLNPVWEPRKALLQSVIRAKNKAPAER